MITINNLIRIDYRKMGRLLTVFACFCYNSQNGGKVRGDKKYVKIAYQRSWAILPNAVFSETVSEILYCLAEIKVPFKVTPRFGVTLNGSFNLTCNDNFLMVIDRE